MRYVYGVALWLVCAAAIGYEVSGIIPSPLAMKTEIPEFDHAQTIAEGRLRITPTDRRDHNRPPLKLSLPITPGMPSGTKLVRLFFNETSQSWCAVVTHPSYTKTSPAVAVPVLTLILKVGD